MTAAFTPGPWNHEVVPCGKYKCVNIGIAKHRKIATVWPIDWDEDEDATVFPMEANANLVTAAPQMHAALKAAYHALRSYQYGNASTELAKSVADACGEALNKSEGV